MKKFDEAVVQRPDGTRQRLTYEEFYRLPLLDRVKALCELRVKFYKDGEPVAAADAIK
jgi:hypothetical protein